MRSQVASSLRTDLSSGQEATAGSNPAEEATAVELVCGMVEIVFRLDEDEPAYTSPSLGAEWRSFLNV